MIPDPGAGDPERDARLAAAYRTGAQQQPPERLDDAIRAAARRAVAAGPRRSADRLRRWSIPLSLAAVVLLSVTLVTMMREEGVDRLMTGEPPPRTQPPVAVADGPAQVPAQPAAQSMSPARKAAAPAAGLQRAVPRTEMPAPELRGQEHREILAADAGSRAKAMAGAAAPADAAADARQDSAPRAADAPRPLLRSAPATTPAPAALAETAAAGAAKPAAAPAGLGALSSAAAPSAKAREALWQDLEGEPVAKWLDRLRDLRKSGRAADAERLFAEFRRRFPDAALPDDLR